ncbi:armadillo/beta-catenin/plakoglobin [Laetiporus sulphureus 93-53]|uniref:uridine/cytidine kinase n=1 Tax=Laetiporus sulphureus 93-53 TaxID=1314785 RepID=A0A165ERM4_9APHY|nr:armadillo/beta-catenin/plakoglobin [Laetiporus sulphureus 93-53]KZT07622.1 armadillo/beta-catenin/plakoglobin [Laetiporus sulphureus 93-53]
MSITMHATTDNAGARTHLQRPPLSRTVTALTARDILLQAKKNTVLKSHGRPPWYGEDGAPISDAFVIGIAGGSASGKTHVARQIVKSLGSIPTVIILSQDSFYKRHTREEIDLAFANRFDLDHPDAIDMPLFSSCLADLKACRQTIMPVYSFTEHQRLDETRYLYGAAIIIAEGIMVLHDQSLRDLYDLKIFVQCDSDLMLARRIRRDVKERGRSVDGILEQYLRYVKPSYDNFVLPTSRYAHIIVPGSDNAVAIDLISTHVRRQLSERTTRLRQRFADAGPRDLLPHNHTPNPTKECLRITLLPQTPQLQGILTVLRDRTTRRGDFIFFLDRLATLLVEKATELLPYRPKTVVTPVEVESHGKQLNAEYVCGVSILRSGGPLEHGLRRVINNIAIGSLLIQSDASTGEPLLLHLQLPICIRHRHLAEQSWVFLLDAQIGTGAAAFMAIRVLLDHGVRQDHIIFITILVARSGGISALQRAFPDVQIVCAAVDDGLRELWLEDEVEGEGHSSSGGRRAWVVEPGMGQIGDRYYL